MNERMIQSHFSSKQYSVALPIGQRNTCRLHLKPGQLTASHWICSLRKKKKTHPKKQQQINTWWSEW